MDYIVTILPRVRCLTFLNVFKKLNLFHGLDDYKHVGLLLLQVAKYKVR